LDPKAGYYFPDETPTPALQWLQNDAAKRETFYRAMKGSNTAVNLENIRANSEAGATAEDAFKVAAGVKTGNIKGALDAGSRLFNRLGASSDQRSEIARALLMNGSPESIARLEQILKPTPETPPPAWGSRSFR
jgi:hypothetical protein